MADTSAESSVVERLGRLFEKGLLPAGGAAEAAKRVIERLQRPARIALLGLPGSGKSSILNLLAGSTVVPESLRLPTVVVQHGAEPRMVCTLSDGQVMSYPGSNLEKVLVQGPALITLEMDLPALKVISLLEVAAGALEADQRRAALWAGKRADILIWCSTAYLPKEQLVWEGMPDAYKDNGILLLTKIDLLGGREAAIGMHERVMQRASGEFRNVLPISAKEARAATADASAVDRDRFRESGAAAVISTIKQRVQMARQADLDMAELLIARHPEPAEVAETPKFKLHAIDGSILKGTAAVDKSTISQIIAEASEERAATATEVREEETGTGAVSGDPGTSVVEPPKEPDVRHDPVDREPTTSADDEVLAQALGERSADSEALPATDSISKEAGPTGADSDEDKPEEPVSGLGVQSAPALDEAEQGIAPAGSVGLARAANTDDEGPSDPVEPETFETILDEAIVEHGDNADGHADDPSEGVIQGLDAAASATSDISANEEAPTKESSAALPAEELFASEEVAATQGFPDNKAEPEQAPTREATSSEEAAESRFASRLKVATDESQGPTELIPLRATWKSAGESIGTMPIIPKREPNRNPTLRQLPEGAGSARLFGRAPRATSQSDSDGDRIVPMPNAGPDRPSDAPRSNPKPMSVFGNRAQKNKGAEASASGPSATEDDMWPSLPPQLPAAEPEVLEPPPAELSIAEVSDRTPPTESSPQPVISVADTDEAEPDKIEPEASRLEPDAMSTPVVEDRRSLSERLGRRVTVVEVPSIPLSVTPRIENARLPRVDVQPIERRERPRIAPRVMPASAPVAATATPASELALLRDGATLIQERSVDLFNQIELDSKVPLDLILEHAGETIAKAITILSQGVSPKVKRISAICGEVQDLIMLMQLERGRTPADDALTLLLQLKREMETVDAT